MSECKHSFNLSYGKYCKICGLSIVDAWFQSTRPHGARLMELSNKLPFQGSEDEKLIYQLAQRALRGRPND